jgi:hypothetical protein
MHSNDMFRAKTRTLLVFCHFICFQCESQEDNQSHSKQWTTFKRLLVHSKIECEF